MDRKSTQTIASHAPRYSGGANLSSPESAYSTGYSTDGTSPGAPPEYYINIRTGKWETEALSSVDLGLSRHSILPSGARRPGEMHLDLHQPHPAPSQGRASQAVLRNFFEGEAFSACQLVAQGGPASHRGCPSQWRSQHRFNGNFLTVLIN